MIKVWLAMGLMLTIFLLGLVQRWTVYEKDQLLANRLVMLKELTASTAIRSKEYLIREEIRKLDQLETLEKAEKTLIDFFDTMRARYDLHLLRKIDIGPTIISMDVKLGFKGSENQAFKELISSKSTKVLTQILSLSYEDRSMEIEMRWSLPYRDGVK